MKLIWPLACIATFFQATLAADFNIDAMPLTDSTHLLTETSLPYLSWYQRPEGVKTIIDTDYEKISRKNTSDWTCNGEEKYLMAQLDEHQLIATLIKEAPAEQKEFYVLDLGAGEFQWCQALANYINHQTFNREFILHIIGVRGEAYNGDEIVQDGQCIIHRYGSFKAENFEEAMKKRHLSSQKLDFVVSHFFFRHLTDSLTTFLQVYGFLRAKTGYMIFDGLAFLLDMLNNKEMSWTTEKSLTALNTLTVSLLTDQKIPYIMYPWSQMRSLNQFVINKPDDAPLQVPLQYIDTSMNTQKTGNLISPEGSTETMVKFHAPQDFPLTWVYKLIERHDSLKSPTNLFGNAKLYEWLSQRQLFYPDQFAPIPSYKGTLEDLK